MSRSLLAAVGDNDGNLIESRSLPRNAGFGVASGYQSPRSMQLQLRFSF